MTARPQDVALLPCPFCGGRAKSKSEFVRCVECGAQMNFGDEDGLDSIISSWNRRSDAALASAQAREEELRAEVEAIAVELDEFADCPARVLTLAGKLRALSTNAAKPGETT